MADMRKGKTFFRRHCKQRKQGADFPLPDLFCRISVQDLHQSAAAEGNHFTGLHMDGLVGRPLQLRKDVV